MNGALRTGFMLVVPALFVLAAACGEDAPPDPEFAPRIEVMAPIDEAELVTAGEETPEYQLRIVSGLPNGCAKYKNTTVNLRDELIVVDVRNTIPEDERVACTEIYGSHERTVGLPGLQPSTDYRVSVNGAVELTLTTEADPQEGIRTVLAPINDFRLELTSESPIAYEFIIDSGLESTCETQGDVSQSRSGGRIFGHVIRVSLTNLEEIDPELECADEFTPYEVRVDLPGTFVSGEDYEIQLNGGGLYLFKGGQTDLRLQPPKG